MVHIDSDGKVWGKSMTSSETVSVGRVIECIRGKVFEMDLSYLEDFEHGAQESMKLVLGVEVMQFLLKNGIYLLDTIVHFPTRQEADAWVNADPTRKKVRLNSKFFGRPPEHIQHSVPGLIVGPEHLN